jgi:hypothetical protein
MNDMKNDKNKNDWNMLEDGLIKHFADECRTSNMAFSILMECLDVEKLKDKLAELQQFRLDKIRSIGDNTPCLNIIKEGEKSDGKEKQGKKKEVVRKRNGR